MLDSIVAAICADTGWDHDPSSQSIHVRLDGGRAQAVRVVAVAGTGAGAEAGAFVRLVSEIGPSAALDVQRTTAALRLNAELRSGAFAIVGEQFAVVDTVSLSDADRPAIQAAIAFVAKTADRYEQVVFGTDEH